MKESTKRITSGLVFVIVIVSILAINNPIVDSVFVLLLSLIGMREFNKCFEAKEYHPIPLVGYLSCFGTLLLGTPLSLSLKVHLVGMIIPILFIIMLAYIIIKQLKVTIVDVAITVLSMLFVPFMFSFIKALFMLQNGRIYVILAFLLATATDTFAYEFGSRIGKHKLAPIVSPHKSIEGSIAGIFGAMIGSGVLTVITNTYFATDFNIILMVVMGAILSIVGQIGDLAASSVKRYCGVKDFGKIMPGHGGILDRFDSVMFIAPVLYACVYIMSLI